MLGQGCFERGEALAGAVTPHPDGVEPEGPLERGRSILLLIVADRDRGVDIEHDQAVSQDGAAIRLGGPSSGSCDQTWRHFQARAFWIFFPRPGVTSSNMRPPGWEGNRPEYAYMELQHVGVSNHLVTIGEHHGHIGQNPTAAMTRG